MGLPPGLQGAILDWAPQESGYLLQLTIAAEKETSPAYELEPDIDNRLGLNLPDFQNQEFESMFGGGTVDGWPLKFKFRQMTTLPKGVTIYFFPNFIATKIDYSYGTRKINIESTPLHAFSYWLQDAPYFKGQRQAFEDLKRVANVYIREAGEVDLKGFESLHRNIQMEYEHVFGAGSFPRFSFIQLVNTSNQDIWVEIGEWSQWVSGHSSRWAGVVSDTTLDIYYGHRQPTNRLSYRTPAAWTQALTPVFLPPYPTLEIAVPDMVAPPERPGARFHWNVTVVGAGSGSPVADFSLAPGRRSAITNGIQTNRSYTVRIALSGDGIDNYDNTTFSKEAKWEVGRSHVMVEFGEAPKLKPEPRLNLTSGQPGHVRIEAGGFQTNISLFANVNNSIPVPPSRAGKIRFTPGNTNRYHSYEVDYPALVRSRSHEVAIVVQEKSQPQLTIRNTGDDPVPFVAMVSDTPYELPADITFSEEQKNMTVSFQLRRGVDAEEVRLETMPDSRTLSIPWGGKATIETNALWKADPVVIIRNTGAVTLKINPDERTSVKLGRGKEQRFSVSAGTTPADIYAQWNMEAEKNPANYAIGGDWLAMASHTTPLKRGSITTVSVAAQLAPASVIVKNERRCRMVVTINRETRTLGPDSRYEFKIPANEKYIVQYRAEDETDRTAVQKNQKPLKPNTEETIVIQDLAAVKEKIQMGETAVTEMFTLEETLDSDQMKALEEMLADGCMAFEALAKMKWGSRSPGVFDAMLLKIRSGKMVYEWAQKKKQLPELCQRLENAVKNAPPPENIKARLKGYATGKADWESRHENFVKELSNGKEQMMSWSDYFGIK